MFIKIGFAFIYCPLSHPWVLLKILDFIKDVLMKNKTHFFVYLIVHKFLYDTYSQERSLRKGVVAEVVRSTRRRKEVQIMAGSRCRRKREVQIKAGDVSLHLCDYVQWKLQGVTPTHTHTGRETNIIKFQLFPIAKIRIF